MASQKPLLSKLYRDYRLKLTISSLLSSSSSSVASLSSPHSFIQSEHLTNTFHYRPANNFKHSLHCPSLLSSTLHPLAPCAFSYSRTFSTRDSESEHPYLDPDLEAASFELSDRGFSGSDENYGSEIAEVLNSVSGEESILPVRALISLLDGYHDLTGLPWWMVIVSSTLALRIALLPLLIVQLKKLKTIAELFPKLPPPLPPPLSGRSYVHQFTLFRKERQLLGCPSYLWFLAHLSTQIPCFLLWITSIRRMSLDHHSGFESGGTLWFQNLSEFSHGVSGFIFPLVIAGLHYAIVQVSFRGSFVGQATGVLGLLAKYYKFYLNFLTVPIFVTGFCVPQGSLVFWVTNSSLTLVQILSIRNQHLLQKFGLPDKQGRLASANPQKLGAPELRVLEPSTKQHKIPVQNLSPRELLALSVQLLAKEQKDRAIPLLRLALDKDPEYVRALVVMGQTLLQKGLPAEATEYLERAISTLFRVGHPSEAEDVDLLILASQWAGAAYVRQGKSSEGIAHLERLAHLEEPKDSKSKVHYYDGLVILASALYNEGRKVEAAKYLRMAVAYNSDYNVYLEQCESEEDNFVSDLDSSRRRDY